MIFCLLVLVFSAHLVCMNLAAGGLLVASSLEVCLRRPEAVGTPIAARLASHSIQGLLAGILLGGAMLLFFWDDSYQDLLFRRLGSRTYFGILEIFFSLALHAIYWRWAATQKGALTKLQRYGRLFLAVVSSANLLYHFPTLFAIIAEVAKDSSPQSAPIGRTELYSFLRSGPILSHAIHFFLASIAVSGVTGAMFARKDPTATNVGRICTSLALISTVLQIPVGIAVYLTLPGAAQQALTGNSLPLSITFLASLASALWLMQSLLGQLPSDAPKQRPLWSALALLITILLMSGVLWGTRANRLKSSASIPRTAKGELACF